MPCKTKALVLLSGGLDSMLAVKLLQLQGVEVVGICFESNFFNADKARIAAEKLGIEIKVEDIREDELELVKNPPNGYGKNLNPCIDCHGLMIRKTNEILEKEGFDIIATGEVSGQRPFSQNKNNLDLVQKIAGVEVLRPLSAKNLEETEYEKKGLVDRKKLLDINGRSRERQMELAKKYGIKDYPTPAGGCILTDPEFSQRLLKMLEYWPDCTPLDAELLKHGRVFWLKLKDNKNILLVIGRHEEDNKALERLAQKGDIMLELKEKTGPLAVVRISNFRPYAEASVGRQFPILNNNYLEINIPERLKMSELNLGEEKEFEEILNIACLFTGYYSTKARGKKEKVILNNI